ncbi:unnamed protein product [Bubo scandiacus]
MSPFCVPPCRVPPRRPCRDWRSLLPDLERMVPWPRGGGGHRTQAQVLENVLGYIRYLQRILSIAQGGAALFADVYLSPQKKCVNGFIMFCRLNRKQYMSAHPGLASTVATRELAQLWHSLSPDERRPYCLWARRFSRLHNRVTRPDGDGDGDANPPAPLQLLLAACAGTPGGGLLPP